MLSRVLIALVLMSVVVGTGTGQPSVVRTATAEQAFPRGRRAETVTRERYSLTLEIDPAPPEFSGEVEIALRNQATQRIRRASGTMSGGGFSLNAQSASRPRTGRGWKARAKDSPVWRRPARDLDDVHLGLDHWSGDRQVLPVRSSIRAGRW